MNAFQIVVLVWLGGFALHMLASNVLLARHVGPFHNAVTGEPLSQLAIFMAQFFSALFWPASIYLFLRDLIRALNAALK